MVAVLVAYWAVAIFLLVYGVVKLIYSSVKGVDRENAVQIVVIAVVMLVIGGGVCGLLLKSI